MRGAHRVPHVHVQQSDGVRRVLVCPVGFVSDHLEILWDLDIEARERADELGLELERIESLNDDPAFIGALAALVRERLPREVLA